MIISDRLLVIRKPKTGNKKPETENPKQETENDK